MPERLEPAVYRDLIRQALAEDIGAGDVTSLAIVPADREATGVFTAKSALVIAGFDLAREVFAQVDARVVWQQDCNDGSRCQPGDRLGRVRGSARSLLAAERTALNLVQHLSGIATLTRAFVEAAAPMTVLDTRKTLPGMRALAKYAVACGGGRNHRLGLFDAVLIKDNHIRVAGSIGAAVRLAREAHAPGAIEVETQSLEQVDDALRAGVDIIMLDNLDDTTTAEAIARVAGRAKIELSGNMTIERVRRLSSFGADFVSVGALTHSAPAADISLEIAI
ncbi:MAG: carboxylating nicotinate-nucleotide diphosphorylase [Acidobacteria bacterium]|nr:carboxylating nicotinate-nucleotide diphosphorylase [Acidobacteriota bacterium]